MKRFFMLFVAAALFAGLLVDGWHKMYPPENRGECEVIPAGLWTPASEAAPAKQMHELPVPLPPTVEQGREIVKQISFAEVVLSANEKQIVDETNKYRVKNGLKPLQVDAKLMESARKQAELQTRHGMRHHLGPFKGAENIASGSSDGNGSARMWWNSSGHRNNMLGRNHTKIGVGFVGRQSCQQFR
jgi:uncharacterized protein YkwD